MIEVISGVVYGAGILIAASGLYANRKASTALKEARRLAQVVLTGDKHFVGPTVIRLRAEVDQLTHQEQEMRARLDASEAYIADLALRCDVLLTGHSQVSATLATVLDALTTVSEHVTNQRDFNAQVNAAFAAADSKALAKSARWARMH